MGTEKLRGMFSKLFCRCALFSILQSGQDYQCINTRIRTYVGGVWCLFSEKPLSFGSGKIQLQYKFMSST